MVSKETIEKEITKLIRNWNTKCSSSGAKPSSGSIGRGEAPKYELYDGDLTNELLNTIADDMAKRWGLEVSVDEKGRREIAKNKFKLWDDKHKTIINLGKIIKHQDWIDFTNNDNGTYNLDEVLKYYDDLDDLAKDRMGGLFFETTNGSSFCRQYHGGYDVANSIHISTMVYHKYDEKGYQLPTISSHNREPSMYNLKEVLGHEAGHARTRILTKQDVDVLRKASVKGSINKVNITQLTTDEERRIYDGLIRGNKGGADDLSGTKEYDDALDANKVRMASWYSKSYNTIQSSHREDVAEVMSAVSYRNATPQEKKEFKMIYDVGVPNPKVVGLDEFIKDHQATYDLCCDYVDGKISHKDLQYTGWIGEKYG